MDNKDQDLLEKIHTSTEDIKVPDGLKPDQIEQLLKEETQKKRKLPYVFAGAAAIAAIALVSVFALNQSRKVQPVDKKAEAAVSDASQKRVDKKIAQAENYSEVYKSIKNSIEQQSSIAQKESKAVADSALGGNSMAKNGSAEAQTYAGSDYSETNTRQAGVNEGDTVKTDGAYLYTLNENAREIGIVSTADDRLNKVTSVSLEDGAQIAEFYVENQQLIILYNVSPEMKDGVYLGENTQVTVYDIADPQNPKEQGTVTQSGRFDTSRLVNGYLYVFSNFGVYQEYQEKEIDMYVPAINGKSIAESNICLPGEGNASEYKVISAVQLTNPSEITDSKAVLSKGGMCYVSNENIYICDAKYSTTNNRTILRKITYADGKLTPQVQGEIKGTLDDTFSIDEYEGKLRLVATLDRRQIIALREASDSEVSGEAQETGNVLYVLDKDLEIIGKIVDIAPGEMVKSARFMGDTGYFVTFRNTDPLFSVDLSTPKEPKLIGELKIPGFSEYLHPYGEGLLLGIGLEMDEAGMTMEGVKISMFNVSDPSDVAEEAKEVMENTYSSSAIQDYRNVLVDAERNLIGFAADGNTEAYYIYSYEQGEGFTCKLKADMGMGSYMPAKGVYVGDQLYIVKGNIIQLYDLTTFKKLDDLVL